MAEQLTPLALVKAQRDQLAVQLHDLHVSHQMTLAALADTNARLAAAEAQIAKRMQSAAELVDGIVEQHQALSACAVNVAGADHANSAA